jgi:hypothetical protein
MRDVELDRHLLDLRPPWLVTQVDLCSGPRKLDSRISY